MQSVPVKEDNFDKSKVPHFLWPMVYIILLYWLACDCILKCNFLADWQILITWFQIKRQTFLVFTTRSNDN